MMTKETFVGLIKAYTADAAYDIIGAKMRATKFSPLIGYVSTIMQGLNEHHKDYNYRLTQFPVWRGMSAEYTNMSDYELGKLGYWPTFSSSTKQKSVALSFMPKDKAGVLLKIFLSAENNPTTHIDCIGTKPINDSKGNVM